MRIVVAATCLGWMLLSGCGQSQSSKPPEFRKTVHNEPSGGSAPPPGFPTGNPWNSGQTKATVVRVFYGTDRNATGRPEPNDFFSNERGSVQFGFCDVSIPKIHETGEIERPKMWKFEFRENPDKHVMVTKVEPADGDTFLDALKNTVESSDSREAFVFVHGYNVTFESAARRTAQIAYDLKFRGAPIFFSWPARGEIEDYTVDEDTAEWAEAHVTQFIEAVALASGAKRMHLIAHSMGNRILTNALDRMAQRPSFGVAPEFNQVILTAPDVDALVFKQQIAPRIIQSAERITIYASSNDRALQASRYVHGNARLGQAGQYLTTFPDFPKIEVIDASEVDTSLFSLRHSYYAENVSVLDDIRDLLAGRKPLDRGLKQTAGAHFWSMLRKKRLATGPTSQLD